MKNTVFKTFLFSLGFMCADHKNPEEVANLRILLVNEDWKGLYDWFDKKYDFFTEALYEQSLWNEYYYYYELTEIAMKALDTFIDQGITVYEEEKVANTIQNVECIL